MLEVSAYTIIVSNSRRFMVMHTFMICDIFKLQVDVHCRPSARQLLQLDILQNK